MPVECPHHAEERIALGPFQRGRAGILVVFAADVVILGPLRRHRFLLVLLYRAWCPAQVCLTPNRSLPGAGHVSVGATSTTVHRAPRAVGAQVCDG